MVLELEIYNHGFCKLTKIYIICFNHFLIHLLTFFSTFILIRYQLQEDLMQKWDPPELRSSNHNFLDEDSNDDEDNIYEKTITTAS